MLGDKNGNGDYAISKDIIFWGTNFYTDSTNIKIGIKDGNRKGTT